MSLIGNMRNERVEVNTAEKVIAFGGSKLRMLAAKLNVLNSNPGPARKCYLETLESYDEVIICGWSVVLTS